MYIGLFDLGDGSYELEMVPGHLVDPDKPAKSALEYVADQEWGLMPGYIGLFIKVGGQ